MGLLYGLQGLCRLSPHITLQVGNEKMDLDSRGPFLDENEGIGFSALGSRNLLLVENYWDAWVKARS